MNIHKIFGILNQIETQSAKTTKEQILKNNKDDKDLLTVLDFLLNPFITTGISTKKMKKTVKKPDFLVVSKDLDGLIQYIKDNSSGRDLDVAVVQLFVETLESEELQVFVKKLVTKDLKLGISEKTVNKVFGKNTIPEFGVMLAESYG
jgi:DNA ligase-1